MMKYNTEFQGGLTVMQRAEQAYIDSIDQMLAETPERMNQPDYQTFPVTAEWISSVFEEINGRYL